MLKSKPQIDKFNLIQKIFRESEGHATIILVDINNHHLLVTYCDNVGIEFVDLDDEDCLVSCEREYFSDLFGTRLHLTIK
jgi:hypothetical protein